MSDIGINFRVDAQTDGLKQASSDFDAFKDKIASVLGITDPEKAEEFWQEYNSGLDEATRLAGKMSEIQSRNDRIARKGGGGGAGGGGGDEDDDGKVLKFPGRSIFQAERTMRGVIAGAGHDAVGTAVNASESIFSKIGSVWEKMPLPAKIATGIAGIAVAGVAEGNELSKQYEAQIPTVMSVTAALKQFGTTADAQSKQFRTVMGEISASAQKYNYTFEQAAGTIETIARAGGRTPATSAESVMKISKSLGLAGPSGAFTELAGYGSRFGMADAEKYALWASMKTVGSQRAEEVAGAFQSMAQNVIETGAEADPAKIAGTQKWLYQIFGERAGGSGAASAFANMSGAVRGSTSLGSETDIMKFQAARKLSGGDNMKALMMLEKGFTPELFEEFKKNIAGASEWDQNFLISKAFGTNLTIADQMRRGEYKPGDTVEDNPTAVSELPAGSKINDTKESQIIGAQEKISEALRETGATVFDLKVDLLKDTAKIVSWITGTTPEQKRKQLIEQNYQTKWGDFEDTMGKQFAGDSKIDPSLKLSLVDKRWGDINEGSRIFRDIILTNPYYHQAMSYMPDAEKTRLMAINGAEDGKFWSKGEALKFLEEISKYLNKMSNDKAYIQYVGGN